MATPAKKPAPKVDKFSQRDKTKPVVKKKKPGPKPKRVRKPPERRVTIYLHTEHRVNEIPYGPGQVSVPVSLASVLMDGEKRVAEGEAILHGERAFIFHPVNTRRPPTPVNPEAFTSYLNSITGMAVN